MASSADTLFQVVRELDAGLRLLRDFGVRQLTGERTAESESPRSGSPKSLIENHSRTEYRFGDGRRAKWEQAAMARTADDESDTTESSMGRQSVLFGSRRDEQEHGAVTIEPELPEPPDPVRAQAALDELRAEIGDCQRCRLAQNRNKIVFGEGSPAARLVFAGEGPGRDEDSSGRPFVGRAGKLLDRIIAAMGFSREEVYICNVVKCRPPNNRTPEDGEMRTCGQFLEKQLQIVHPRHILCLGGTAARYLLGTEQPMGKLRGRFFDHPATGARIMPTYHPAYLLRNEDAKRPVWEDVKRVMSEMEQPVEEAP